MNSTFSTAKLVSFFGAAAIAAATGTMTLAQDNQPEAERHTVNLCTGGDGGKYYSAGQQIAGFANGSSIDVNVIETLGSWDNMRKLKDGTCDAAVSQPDAYEAFNAQNGGLNLLSVGELHKEYVHVLCNSSANIDSLSDIEGSTDHVIAIGKNGSGAWTTFTNWGIEDSDYQENTTSPEGGRLAAAKVSTTPNTCMMSVVGLGSSSMGWLDANFGDQLTLVEVRDKDFDDSLDSFGTPLYQKDTIPGEAYSNLTPAGRVYGRHDVDTISMTARVYINANMPEEAATEFITATAMARPSILAPQ